MRWHCDGQVLRRRQLVRGGLALTDPFDATRDLTDSGQAHRVEEEPVEGVRGIYGCVQDCLQSWTRSRSAQPLRVSAAAAPLVVYLRSRAL
jgi:hypothetical protein